MFQKGLEEMVVIQNQVASIVITEQTQQGLVIGAFLVESSGDELEILGCELDAAIGLNQLHITISRSMCSVEKGAYFVPKVAEWKDWNLSFCRDRAERSFAHAVHKGTYDYHIYRQRRSPPKMLSVSSFSQFRNLRERISA
jgi:hypothetical protein